MVSADALLKSMQLQITAINPSIHQLIVSYDDEEGNHGEDNDDVDVSDSSCASGLGDHK